MNGKIVGDVLASLESASTSCEHFESDYNISMRFQFTFRMKINEIVILLQRVSQKYKRSILLSQYVLEI